MFKVKMNVVVGLKVSKPIVVKKESFAKLEIEEPVEEDDPDSKLYMFYNHVNLESLAKVLPLYENDEEIKDYSLSEKIKFLKSKAVPLLCHGWTQVFSKEHISMEVA